MRPIEGVTNHQDPQPLHPRGRVRGTGYPNIRPQDSGQAERASHRGESGPGTGIPSALSSFKGDVADAV